MGSKKVQPSCDSVTAQRGQFVATSGRAAETVAITAEQTPQLETQSRETLPKVADSQVTGRHHKSAHAPPTSCWHATDSAR